MTARERLIETAKAEIGYKEGSNNWNRYAEYLDADDSFYNGKKQNQPWCDVFVDWCFASTFGNDLGRRMLYQPTKSCGAGCKFSMGYFSDANALYSAPEIGDQIFIKGSSGNAEHTGIVYAVTDSTITCIEGNASDKVALVSYKSTSDSILGFGRPNWSLAESSIASIDSAVISEISQKLREIADLLVNII